jgi:hypothetical protein
MGVSHFHQFMMAFVLSYILIASPAYAVDTVRLQSRLR